MSSILQCRLSSRRPHPAFIQRIHVILSPSLSDNVEDDDERPGLLLVGRPSFPFRNQRVLFQRLAGLSCDTSRVSYHVFMLTVNYYRSRIYVEMKTPWFFSGNACGKNKKKLFVFPRKLNYGKLRTNPSGNEVPACEVRDPLGSKISAVGRAKLSKRNYPVEELYPRNYRRGIIRKLRRIKLLG